MKKRVLLPIIIFGSIRMILILCLLIIVVPFWVIGIQEYRTIILKSEEIKQCVISLHTSDYLIFNDKIILSGNNKNNGYYFIGKGDIIYQANIPQEGTETNFEIDKKTNTVIVNVYEPKKKIKKMLKRYGDIQIKYNFVNENALSE